MHVYYVFFFLYECMVFTFGFIVGRPRLCNESGLWYWGHSWINVKINCIKRMNNYLVKLQLVI